MPCDFYCFTTAERCISEKRNKRDNKKDKPDA